MKTYSVFFTSEAENDLGAIYDYIALEKSMPDVAWTYIQKLKKACATLENAPLRGCQRDDLRQNLRILSLAKNAVAAFEVDETRQTVMVLNIFYGGRDYDTIMKGAESKN